MTTSTRASRSLLDLVRRLGRFVNGVTGADAYERFVEHQRRVHPEAPVPGRAEFWRDRYAEQERNPGARCC